MTNQLPQEKPVWDKSKDGRHPALRDLTVTEREALEALARSVEMAPRDKERAQLLQFLIFYNNNYLFFKNLRIPEKASFYLSELIKVLTGLGRFEDALKFIGRKSGYVKERKFLKKYLAAEKKSDNKTCKCKRPVELVNIAQNPAQTKEVELTLNRHSPLFEYYSEKRGEWVKMWECRVCGDLNANPNVPERQAEVFMSRESTVKLSDEVLLK